MTHMYSWTPFGFLGSSPLDTKERRRNMILNDIMMFQTSTGVNHTCNLELSGKQIPKKSRMFVVVKLS